MTEKQEALLQKYFDGECNLWESFLAARLLRHDVSARSYITDLKKIDSVVLRNFEELEDNVEVDLWDKISRRIDQEERTAVYLGRRSVVKEKHFSNFLWGMSGAAVATAAGIFSFMFVRDAQLQDSVPSGGKVQIASNQIRLEEPVPPVSTVSYNNTTPSSHLQTFAESPVEVDWMKSDGKISLIRGKSPNSSVIWVKRNKRILPPLYLRRYTSGDEYRVNPFLSTSKK